MCRRLKQIIIIHYVNVTDAGCTPARTHKYSYAYKSIYVYVGKHTNALEYMSHCALEYAAMQLCYRTRSGRCHKQFNLFQLLQFPTAPGTVPIATATTTTTAINGRR